MWIYNNIRIFVTAKADSIKQIIARLQPLAGGTVHHVFGHEDDVAKLECVVVGDTDLDALKALAATGTAYTLSGYGTVYGDFLLSSIQWVHTNAVAQTLRPDLDCDSPVYVVEMELYID